MIYLLCYLAVGVVSGFAMNYLAAKSNNINAPTLKTDAWYSLAWPFAWATRWGYIIGAMAK